MICHYRRILSLYLSSHIIYLLQSLNVIIFESLQKIYEDIVNRKCENKIDFINKDLFINIYTKAREKSFRLSVIQARFKVIDLVLLNSKEIYKRLFQGQKEDSFNTQELELLESLTSKTLKTSRQLRNQIQLLRTIYQSLIIELRLRKLEKEFIILETNNILLNQ